MYGFCLVFVGLGFYIITILTLKDHKTPVPEKVPFFLILIQVPSFYLGLVSFFVKIRECVFVSEETG